jgi:hypothetical protein
MTDDYHDDYNVETTTLYELTDTRARRNYVHLT